MPQKLIVVSNRLPVQAILENDTWVLKRTAGGLATALEGIKGSIEFEWVGWPGTRVAPGHYPALREKLIEEFKYVPVFLEPSEIRNYYNGFSNQVLWPLFHYMPNRIEFSDHQWKAYQEVNQKFADEILARCDDDSIVWVHDFHLMLLPKLLRDRKPGLKIGFFLHTPFPSSEIYRLLPVRREILQGMVGADIIGFHTHDYGRHFVTSCLRILGLESEFGEIMQDDRAVRIECYPIGISPEEIQSKLHNPKVSQKMAELKTAHQDRAVIAGVDRIDYIKGLPLKFRAFERFLERYPEHQGKVVLMQVAVPSRNEVADYKELKKELDELVGRINGRFGSMSYSPIHYIARGFGPEDLYAFYKCADVMLITSERDGMNLVAFEYSYCKEGEGGALVLSEFAGAAQIFSEGLIVNPWDFDGVAAALHRALTMPDGERARRAKRNFALTNEFTSVAWAKRFLKDLGEANKKSFVVKLDLTKSFIQLQREFSAARRRRLFLDYDGTLVPIADKPEAAVPGKRLVEVLAELTRDPKNEVFLISGRTTVELDRWFGAVPNLRLAGEHGLFFKMSPQSGWQELFHVPNDWKVLIRPLLEDFVRRTPGTFIEDKRAGLAWHYRLASDEFGERSAHDLTLHLEETLANVPVEVIRGKKVIEVRSVGANKGSLVSRFLEQNPTQTDDLVLCLGDDRTDEDMFAVLPEDAWTCRVGSRQSRAKYYLQDSREVIQVLEALCQLH